MERRDIENPSLTREDLSRLLPPSMNLPGLSTLFGHLSESYIKYISGAMDSYTWFRYVEAESKSYVLKRVATRTLYRMLNRQPSAQLLGGNENGYLMGERACGFTSRGVNYKNINEDGIGIFDHGEKLNLVVCDGVGDCLVGEVASWVILDHFAQYPEKRSPELLSMSCHRLIEMSHRLAQEIPEFVTFPNEISQAAVTALEISGNRCAISAVGDVILYHLRQDQLTMMDPGGSWLGLSELSNLFSNEKYLAQRHIISNAIGRNYDDSWSPRIIDLASGDLLVLASDGLETLHPKDLRRILMDEKDLPLLLDRLYDAVIRANLRWQTPGCPLYTKPDNISIVLYRHQA